MEFYTEIVNEKLDKNSLKELLTISNLPELCRSIDTVIHDDIDSGTIYCVWGEFGINREEINTGIRFTLPNCPNTIAWTITCDEHTANIIIHFTMNKKEHDADFLASIEQFMTDWEVN